MIRRKSLPSYRVVLGDVREIASHFDAENFDGCLCDPPYGLSFMGKKWDYDVPSTKTWAAILQALKPGAHLLAFAGTRTQHRMAVRIEDAGFEIRDMIVWVYGSGFPKSHNLRGEFDGYGTALKPALEPITVARKPIIGTVAANCQKYGAGAINVDGCRVGDNPGYKYAADRNGSTFHGEQGNRIKQTADKRGAEFIESTKGRWPANLIHDGSEEVLAGFPKSGGSGPSRTLKRGMRDDGWGMSDSPGELRDAGSGSAARFFYCAKASRSEREAGLREAGLREAGLREAGGIRTNASRAREEEKNPKTLNHHPTVKPLALAEYLARLILPPKRDTPRRLLAPFSGSGSEIIGALRAGWDEVVGIEIEEEYRDIAIARINHALKTGVKK